MKSKYDPVLKIMPETEHRPKVFFRVAGDDFIEVEHGTAKTDMDLNY